MIPGSPYLIVAKKILLKFLDISLPVNQQKVGFLHEIGEKKRAFFELAGILDELGMQRYHRIYVSFSKEFRLFIKIFF